MKKKADYIIDTSNLLTRELKEELDRIFIRNEEYNNLMITLLSFGFKYGIPRDADLVFDVRFLPNPFYVPELKMRTGLESAVADYVLQYPQTKDFINKLDDMLSLLIPHYIEEGKTELVIAIGCTGGKHRSVTIAIEIEKVLKNKNFKTIIRHRDINKD